MQKKNPQKNNDTDIAFKGKKNMWEIFHFGHVTTSAPAAVPAGTKTVQQVRAKPDFNCYLIRLDQNLKPVEELEARRNQNLKKISFTSNSKNKNW